MYTRNCIERDTVSLWAEAHQDVSLMANVFCYKGQGYKFKLSCGISAGELKYKPLSKEFVTLSCDLEDPLVLVTGVRTQFV